VIDIKIAAEKMRELIEVSSLMETLPQSVKKPHLRYMVDMITSGEIEGEKANRWLGWIQASIYFGGGATLEELKRINSGDES